LLYLLWCIVTIQPQAYYRGMKRPYRLITKDEIAKHQEAVIRTGNNTAAVLSRNGDLYRSPHVRGHAIAKKVKNGQVLEYLDERIQQGSVRAIERVVEMVESRDERVATKNAHYLVDHVRGKALQRSETRNVNLNIQSVIE
jgi:hypothetical protein